MIRLFALVCLAGLLVLSACSAVSASPETPSSGAIPPSRKPVPVEPGVQAEVQPVKGEVPEAMLDSLKADLAKREGLAASDIRVVAAESVVWPNGALGCPQPGRMYTQALVPGYRVQLEAGGRTFNYHAAQRGHFVLCPAPSGNAPGHRDAVK